MKILLFVLLIGVNLSFSSGSWITYNDGTPSWLCWGNSSRGVWFSLEDFVPSPSAGWELEETEVWFYHDVSYPWDTSDTYIEFWNGGSDSPEVLLQKLPLTAIHYAPVYLNHSPDWIPVDLEFWIIQTTELSTAGWPSMVGDESVLPVPHSRVLNNTSIWEPFSPAPGVFSELFISTSGAYSWQHGAALNQCSWGHIKVVF